jgi:DNA-binding NarL/FixJ family response regulator
MSSILVVDDHPIIAEACRVVLGDVEDVVAARDVPSGYEAFLEHRPDVVILDLSFPGEPLGGVDLLRRIFSDAPLTRVLIFSMHADADIVASAIKAGAIGYLLKDSSPAELPTAVRQVRSGHRYVDERIKLRATHLPVQAKSPLAGALTRREKQALGLLGQENPIQQSRKNWRSRNGLLPGSSSRRASSSASTAPATCSEMRASWPAVKFQLMYKLLLYCRS